MFCKKCGKNITNNICPYCGCVHSENDEAVYYSFSEFKERREQEGVYKREDKTGNKSRLTAGVLQLFVGCIGLGRFYMGYKTIGVLQILSSVFTFGFAGVVWGFVDGILILNSTVNYDGDGNLLC